MRTEYRQVSIGGIYSYNSNEIFLIKAEENYTRLYFTNGKQTMLCHHLGRLEQQLAPTNSFIRPNRGSLVNLQYLDSFTPENVKVRNYDVKISRRRKEAILEQLTVLESR